MPAPFRWPRFVVVALLGGACTGEPAGPGSPATPSRVEVSPGSIQLRTASAENTVQLTVRALDAMGGVMQDHAPVRFRSGDTLVARVDASGVVTVREPGQATVYATIGTGTEARTGSMHLTAWSGLDPLDLEGVYDVTMVNHLNTPGDIMGPNLFGYRLTATLHLQGRTATGLTGSTSDWRFSSPDGADQSAVHWAPPVSSTLSAYGQEAVALGDLTLFVVGAEYGIIRGRWVDNRWGGGQRLHGVFELQRR